MGVTFPHMATVAGASKRQIGMLFDICRKHKIKIVFNFRCYKSNLFHRQCSAPLCGPSCEEKGPHKQVCSKLMLDPLIFLSFVQFQLVVFPTNISQECSVLSKHGVGEKLSKDANLLWLITPLRLILLSSDDPSR